MIEDPATPAYWIFKVIVNGFIGLVLGGVVVAFFRALHRQ